MSLTKSLYHIVINTYRRQMTIPEDNKRQLYAYIYGIIKAKRCKLLRMNGIANHIHILADLAPDMALSTLMREIKRSSSVWAKNNRELFPHFDGWAKEYYAFSCSERERENIYNYIINQESHHRVVSFDDELNAIAEENGCKLYNEEGNITSST